jgi:hypothetical protein
MDNIKTMTISEAKALPTEWTVEIHNTPGSKLLIVPPKDIPQYQFIPGERIFFFKIGEITTNEKGVPSQNVDINMAILVED